MRKIALPLLLLAACGAPTGRPLASFELRAGEPLAATLVAPTYSSANHAEEFKVYHHLYDLRGQLLTKGNGGEFPHHRGLSLAWNKVGWRNQSFDFWHGRNGEHQRSTLLHSGAGQQHIEIDWCNRANETLLRERRSLRTALLHVAQQDTLVFWFDTSLTALDDAVHLDGDPQHAGQQFRALQQFAEKTGPKVRYLRPQGAKDQGNDVWTDCEWIAAILPMPEGPVTVLRCEMPGNPTALWSTRDYGRFGATWTLDLQPRTPLRLQVGYAITQGEPSAEWCAAASAALRGAAK